MVEDNSFDFKVRDRLQKECRERNWKLRRYEYDSKNNRVMIDMITYCSQGDEEEAVRNLISTKMFMDRFKSSCQTLGMPVNTLSWAELNAEEFMFLFWKKSFIELKVAIHKSEKLPRVFSQAIIRDLGRFLDEQNFNNSQALKNEARIAMEAIRADTVTLNNIFKDIPSA